jgi:hypothetical protein
MGGRRLPKKRTSSQKPSLIITYPNPHLTTARRNVAESPRAKTSPTGACPPGSYETKFPQPRQRRQGLWTSAHLRRIFCQPLSSVTQSPRTPAAFLSGQSAVKPFGFSLCDVLSITHGPSRTNEPANSRTLFSVMPKPAPLSFGARREGLPRATRRCKPPPGRTSPSRPHAPARQSPQGSGGQDLLRHRDRAAAHPLSPERLHDLPQAHAWSPRSGRPPSGSVPRGNVRSRGLPPADAPPTPS